MLKRSFQQNLETYADVVISLGVNLQPGQVLTISAEPVHKELIMALMERAYKKGAKDVIVDLSDPEFDRIKVLNVKNQDYLDFLPEHAKAKFKEIVDNGHARIRICGMEKPDILEGLDVSRIEKANFEAIKYFYDEGIDKGNVQWCVIAGATKGWAEKVFPKVPPVVAHTKLWDYIFKITRSDRDDALDAWERHLDLLRSRSEKLNDLGIDMLRFQGEGTDLTVGLSHKALFMSAFEKTHRGISYCANIPTEEVYTTPDRRRTRGHFAATRPVLVGGNLVEGLKVVFDNEGGVANFSCRKGHEAFEKNITADEGARFLGEVAKVGVDSPIFESGIISNEILTDENAACHVALGGAYRTCFKDFAQISDEEYKELGCNYSSRHLDVMISNKTTDVTAVTRDGKEVLLLKKGRWQI